MFETWEAEKKGVKYVHVVESTGVDIWTVTKIMFSWAVSLKKNPQTSLQYSTCSLLYAH